MRITITKTKNSETIYITHSYVNSTGKSTSRTHKKLGTISDLSISLNTDRDGVIAWAKQQAKLETEYYKQDCNSISIPFSYNKFIPLNQQTNFNCGYLFLQKILSNLRTHQIFKNIINRHNIDLPLDLIFNDLVCSHILSYTNPQSSFEFSEYFLRKPNYQLDDIYHCLSTISQETMFIQNELYQNCALLKKRNFENLYYDSSQYLFHLDGNHTEDHFSSQIVTMGLYMDMAGFPLAFDLFDEHMNNPIALNPLVGKVMRDFSNTKLVFSSNVGRNSKTNRIFDSFGSGTYVVSKQLNKINVQDRKKALDTTKFRKMGTSEFIDIKYLDEKDEDVLNSIYFNEVEITTDTHSETLIITYSPKLKKYQQANRANLLYDISNLIANDHKNNNAFNDESYNATFEKRIKKIQKDEKYDGFSAVTTNLSNQVKTVKYINTSRLEIEALFRPNNKGFKFSDSNLNREDRIKAHFIISFTSLLVCRLLEYTLNYKYSIHDIIITLRNMNLVKIDEYGYIPSYTRSIITDELHDKFGFHTDFQILNKNKLNSIIKSIYYSK